MKRIILSVAVMLLLFGISYEPQKVIAADVNESSTAILVMTFKNELGVATTPTTLEYRLDNVSTGAIKRNWTSITPADVVNVEITDVENAISSLTRPQETMRVTVRWTYETTKKWKAEYLYNIINLAKIQ